jgi:DNA-binding transcriptional regulator YhcF (GntR family)
VTPWDFTLQIDRTNERTLFMQIATAIVQDICRGRLRAGDRLTALRER